MSMRTFLVSLWCMCSLVSWSAAWDECTSAVVGPAGSAAGAPLLWKNRDTGELANKVVFVADEPYSYVGLVDASAPSGRHVYAGLNEVGFAIINTVAYNLPEPAGGELEDLEGIIMADALRGCRTVDDFERYLAANLGPDLGAWSNFGVIDGEGGARLYEVHNNGFERIEVTGLPRSLLVNTNFARSGEQGTGAGYLRHERASALFAGLGEAPVEWPVILQRFTRDLGHPLLDHPSWQELAEAPATPPLWVSTKDTIDKDATSAAVVIVGRRPGEAWPPATMWVIPGEPVTAVAVPLWVEAAASPTLLWQGEEAAMWRESMRLKRIARPFPELEKEKYLDLTRLDNADGTGFLPGLLAAEAEVLEATRAFLAEPRSSEELARFSEEMAALAYRALQAAGS
jgi:hypothetical protein